MCGLAYPGSQAPKKHCHRTIIVVASDFKGVAQPCQTTAIIVAGSLLRIPLQASPNPDYSLVISDVISLFVLQQIKTYLLPVRDPYHLLICSPSG